MTDAEWALIEPHMPEQKALGRPRIVRLRGVVDALLYILRTACPWRLLPRDFPKRSTVQRYFYAWQKTIIADVLDRLHFARRSEFPRSLTSLQRRFQSLFNKASLDPQQDSSFARGAAVARHLLSDQR